jgi:hypothetical protein
VKEWNVDYGNFNNDIVNIYKDEINELIKT